MQLAQVFEFTFVLVPGREMYFCAPVTDVLYQVCWFYLLFFFGVQYKFSLFPIIWLLIFFLHVQIHDRITNRQLETQAIHTKNCNDDDIDTDIDTDTDTDTDTDNDTNNKHQYR